MENRFKFRVWDKKENKTYDWAGRCIFDVLHCYDEYPCEAYGADASFPNFYGGTPEKDDCIFMQCLGIKDKNGKLIYESDLFEMYGKIFQVVWDSQEVGFRLKGNNVSMLINPKDGKLEFEIIGNIYENPELLIEE